MIRLYTILFLVLLVPSVYADSTFEQEVAHLLNFVEQSDCTFIRNGKAHSSVEARRHIEKKYTYIKSRISTTEHFIVYGASKSSITGKAYTVECNGSTISSEQWLREELVSFRHTREVDSIKAEEQN